ncbi:MAG: SpoIID/LytB domain-containing protein [Actinobacteria bacterium]|nr:SpoIID/LytB domain-containing protein [Actinomycetota bacterium]
MRLRSPRRVRAALLTVLVGGAFLPFAPQAQPPALGYPGLNVALEGAGWGHGRGMGQYGSLGYALDSGWTYSMILDHFYGGTASANIGNPEITVRLVAVDGQETVATSTGGLVSAAGQTAAAIRVVQIGTNVYDVYTGPGCGGGWTLSAGSQTGPVNITAAAGLVQVCATGRAYRGYLQATRDSEGPQRTVNVVAMEDYLRGVVPRESPASWGDLGGGAGMHALRAQAVAARSYAAAEGRYSYAKTCDTTACQVYGGYSLNGSVLEDARTDSAVTQTAGEVRQTNGATARTEFSSSTGGYTAGGTFPAVVDDGDDVSQNPNHRWTANVPVVDIQLAYPEIGLLRTVEVTQRNGLGDWGGRVKQVVLRGTLGDKTLTGDEFRSRFGLKSDWFRVVNSPSGGVQGYWVLDNQGGVFSFGAAEFLGSVPQLRNQGVRIGNSQIVDVEPMSGGNGYWVLDRAGGIFSFGQARFHGSIPQLREQGVRVGAADVIDIASTPSGNGYWLLDGVGGMFAFGDANFYGSIPQLREQGVKIGRANIVDMTATSDGAGYLMIDDVGGVFAFGSAQFYGSIPSLRNSGVQIGQAQIVGVATTNGGYWMIDSKGGVFAFGSAPFQGSLPGAGISARAAGIAPTKTGGGYLIVTADNGDVHPFGDAPDFGGVPDTGVTTTGRGIAPRYE